MHDDVEAPLTSLEHIGTHVSARAEGTWGGVLDVLLMSSTTSLLTSSPILVSFDAGG
jgi:hypothetical protein